MNVKLAPLLAFVLLSAVLAAGTGSARANGVPQLVKLTYLDGVSNFGPKNAEGVLEFSFAEAYARIELKNLVPVEGYTFEAWMTGPSGNPYFVGPLTVPANGVASIETKLQGLQRYDYNLFIVAARKAGAATGKLPEQKSIAGRFAVIADGAQGAAAGDAGRPGELPDTGQQPAGRDWSPAFAAAAAMGVVVLGWSAARKVRARRRAHD